LTNQELQQKYNDLKDQYDGEINALGDNHGLTAQSKGKRKGKSKKSSTDGKQLASDHEEDSDRLSRSMNSQEKLQRLRELQNKLIGGEEINNEEQKKKRRKRLNEMHEKQEQRTRLTQAIAGNDDDVMMRVFDNAQEEVRLVYFVEVEGLNYISTAVRVA
jgi:hypothetical protein